MRREIDGPFRQHRGSFEPHQVEQCRQMLGHVRTDSRVALKQGQLTIEAQHGGRWRDAFRASSAARSMRRCQRVICRYDALVPEAMMKPGPGRRHFSTNNRREPAAHHRGSHIDVDDECPNGDQRARHVHQDSRVAQKAQVPRDRFPETTGSRPKPQAPGRPTPSPRKNTSGRD